MPALKMNHLPLTGFGLGFASGEVRYGSGGQLPQTRFPDPESDAFNRFSASSEFDGLRHLLPTIYLAEARETRSVVAHLQRIRGGVHWLAMKAGESEESARQMALASIFHDIGMAWIEPLSEPAHWFNSDFSKCEKLNGHCVMGDDFLSGLPSPIMQLAADIARDHHECWDGSGFPSARRGPDLSLAGRIVALVHFFEENTQSDPAGLRMQHEEWSVIEMIAIAAGRYFDPRLSYFITSDPDDFAAAMNPLGLGLASKSKVSDDWNLISDEDCLIDLDLLLRRMPLR